jgi:hypothetical protein
MASPKTIGANEDVANHGNYSGYPAFGGFINDSTAQMGIAVGQQAFAAGQAAVEREVSHPDLSYCTTQYTYTTITHPQKAYASYGACFLLFYKDN